MPGAAILGKPHLIKQSRGEMHDDPLLFALRDPASWGVLVALLAIVFAAL